MCLCALSLGLDETYQGPGGWSWAAVSSTWFFELLSVTSETLAHQQGEGSSAQLTIDVAITATCQRVNLT